jgi:hypothetical protein
MTIETAVNVVLIQWRKAQSLLTVKKYSGFYGRRSFLNFSHDAVANYSPWPGEFCSTDNSLLKHSL